ncbi:hypothetical protein ABTF78_19230, partial [Acinetobacter baumannii]
CRCGIQAVYEPAHAVFCESLTRPCNVRRVAALTLQDFKRPVQNLPQLLPKTSSADFAPETAQL